MPERVTRGPVRQTGLRDGVPHGSLAPSLSRTRISLRAKSPSWRRNRNKPIGRTAPRADHARCIPLLTFGCENGSNGGGASTTISQGTERQNDRDSSTHPARKGAKTPRTQVFSVSIRSPDQGFTFIVPGLLPCEPQSFVSWRLCVRWLSEGFGRTRGSCEKRLCPLRGDRRVGRVGNLPQVSEVSQVDNLRHSKLHRLTTGATRSSTG